MEDQAKKEILEAINVFSSHIDGRIDGLENRIDRLENRMDGLENKVTKIEATMVTKDYLDSKLADMRGDIIEVIRGEDIKLMALAEILLEKKVLGDDDMMRLRAMRPFPQVAS